MELPRGTEASVEIQATTYNYNGHHLHVQLQSPNNGEIVPTVFICLIDISGSMGCEASITGSTEQHGFNRLDLVKHSLKTIINSLDSKHYISLITFTDDAKLELSPLQMTDDGKKTADNKVNSFQPTNSTNIWDALQMGIDTAQTPVCFEKNVQIILLTDGIPNVNPPQGIPQALTTYLNENKLRGTINTFGFGYQLDSQLLEDISRIGLGQFSFIPDATMVGTIFANFLANSLATYIINKEVVIKDLDNNENIILRQQIGSFQYDQPKDIFIKLDQKIQNAKIEFGKKSLILNVSEKIQPANDEFYYQYLRTHIIYLLKYIVDEKKNFTKQSTLQDTSSYIEQQFENLVGMCSSEKFKELLKDLSDPDPYLGQIQKSISRFDWYKEWGIHYLRSLANAHTLQVCNNFRDPGVQLYAGQVFSKYRDIVDDVFINLKPPEPSIKHSGQHSQISSMAAYYNSSGPCFDGYGNVTMKDGTIKQVKNLKKGDLVKNGFKIQCIIKTTVQQVIEIVNINGLIITAWHPIIYNKEWQFPIHVKKTQMQYIDFLYNIVFETGHILEINDIPVIGLGHGFKGNTVIEHEYFGSQNIINDLKQIPGWETGLIELNSYYYTVDKITGKTNKLIYTDFVKSY